MVKSPDRVAKGGAMSAERMSIRKVQEALRLRHALEMSCRAISATTAIGRTAAVEYLRRAAVIGVTCRCLTGSTTGSWSGDDTRRT